MILTFPVKNTFRIDMDGVKILSLMSGGNVAVSGKFKTRTFVKMYSLDDGQMFWNLPQLVGASEITLRGRLCLAISFG